jgi:hypothetical protein
MSENKVTPFEDRCNILSELWMQYRFENHLEDFIQYNDIGLPLAFIVSENLASPNELAKGMINETFDLLMSALKIEDSGFDSIDDVFLEAEI